MNVKKKTIIILASSFALFIPMLNIISVSASTWHPGTPKYLKGKYGKIEVGTQKGAGVYAAQWYKKNNDGSLDKNNHLSFNTFLGKTGHEEINSFT